MLEALLANVPYQVYFKDLDSRFVRVSAEQARKLGFPIADELLGKTDFDVFSDPHARTAFEDEQQIVASGQPILNKEEHEFFADGGEAWVSTSKLPLRDARGEIVGTFGISHDITVRRRAEKMLAEAEELWRSLLVHMEEIVWLVNGDGEITYTSPATQRWLGIESEELIGKTPAALCHDEDSEALKAAMAVGETGSYTCPYRLRAADGSWRWLEATFVRLHGDPAIAAVMMAAHDITERLEIEREREQLEMERRVSQRLEAVGQLAAGIAHEINSPLQFVGDSARFLGESVHDLMDLVAEYHHVLFSEEAIAVEERRRIIARAEEEADLDYLFERIPRALERTDEGIDRVRSIVNAMKRFSHTGGADFAPADLNDGIEATLVVCRNEYKYVADLRFRPGELPPVQCNISELNQVFLNLVINGAQAIAEQVVGSDRRGHIDITTAADGDRAIVTITDDGPGIPLELQDRIYEPFFTTKEVGKGTGQGLALARATIEAHEGTLQCVSAPGAGTTFTISLPVKGRPAEKAD